MGPPHPDRVPAVRVLLVGDSGCGKTSLARLLAEGAAPAEAPLPTQGCDVFVRLVQVPDPGGGAPKAPKAAAQRLFAALRRVLGL